jgi:predicted molibdopterin-dependent oxidoreductase YjgC
MGENPVVSDSDVNHVKKLFEKAKFLIVQDVFLITTAKMAPHPPRSYGILI